MKFLYILSKIINFISIFSICIFIFYLDNYVFVKDFIFTINYIKNFYCFFILLVIILYFIFFYYNNYPKYSTATTIKEIKIDEVNNAEITYVPSYMSYYLISIEIDNELLFAVVILFLILLLYKTRLFYYNPLLYILGYKFYYIKTIYKTNILLITKEEIKKNTTFIYNLIEINEFTYLSTNSKNYED